MKGIILYTSKYGATKQYAEWLAEATGFVCAETKKAKIEEVKQYDTVVLCGGIYASGIAGLSFLKKHIGQLRGKNVIVFCDGASPDDENTVQAIVSGNMKDALADVPCFYGRGRFDMEALGFADQTLVKMLRKAVAKKKAEERDLLEQVIFEYGDRTCDWMDRVYLEPVLAKIGK